MISDRKTSIKDYYFGLGDFSYCYDKFEERYLWNDFKIVNTTPGAWELLKSGNFKGPIFEQLRKDCWIDHTNITFLKSMNEMKLIAIIGWDRYANSLCPEFW